MKTITIVCGFGYQVRWIRPWGWTSDSLPSDLRPWIKRSFSNIKYHSPRIIQKKHKTPTAMAPRRNFDLAFRTMVAEHALEIGNWSEAAREHGIHERTVRRWIQLSDRPSEATLNNPIVARRRRTTARRTRVTRSTDSSTRARAMYPAVDTEVLEFINRKKIEDGFQFTREKIRAEAKRISRVNCLTDFKASIGWYQNLWGEMVWPLRN